MLTIWKFPFDIDDEIVINMPAGAKMLLVECQNKVPCLWAEVDSASELESYRFAIVGTGHPVPEDLHLEHIGSFQDSPFVWHLYHIRETP